MAPLDLTSLARRFDSKVIKSDGCWLWTGAKNSQGYGHLVVDGKLTKATHVSLLLHTGASVPAGSIMCHQCDTPACVRPDHLFVGSYSDNAQDAITKGRQWNRGKLAMCLRGLHPFVEGSFYKTKTGTRLCKACQRAYQTTYRRARRLGVA